MGVLWDWKGGVKGGSDRLKGGTYIYMPVPHYHAGEYSPGLWSPAPQPNDDDYELINKWKIHFLYIMIFPRTDLNTDTRPVLLDDVIFCHIVSQQV